MTGPRDMSNSFDSDMEKWIVNFIVLGLTEAEAAAMVTACLITARVTPYMAVSGLDLCEKELIQNAGFIANIAKRRTD